MSISHSRQRVDGRERRLSQQLHLSESIAFAELETTARRVEQLRADDSERGHLIADQNRGVDFGVVGGGRRFDMSVRGILRGSGVVVLIERRVGIQSRGTGRSIRDVGSRGEGSSERR